MADTLNGTRVAFLAMDGYEDSELTAPWDAVTAAGATAVLVSPSAGTIEGEHGHRQPVDLVVGEADAADFDALVLPGGVVNADDLRLDERSVAFASAFFAQEKPVGAICHAAWLLVEGDVVRGRRMTSYPSLRTDLRNAGATWVDEEVVVDDGFVTSRTPDDLPAFTASLIDQFGAGTRPDPAA